MAAILIHVSVCPNRYCPSEPAWRAAMQTRNPEQVVRLKVLTCEIADPLMPLLPLPATEIYQTRPVDV